MTPAFYSLIFFLGSLRIFFSGSSYLYLDLFLGHSHLYLEEGKPIHASSMGFGLVFCCCFLFVFKLLSSPTARGHNSMGIFKYLVLGNVKNK